MSLILLLLSEFEGVLIVHLLSDTQGVELKTLSELEASDLAFCGCGICLSPVYSSLFSM